MRVKSLRSAIRSDFTRQILPFDIILNSVFQCIFFLCTLLEKKKKTISLHAIKNVIIATRFGRMSSETVPLLIFARPSDAAIFHPARAKIYRVRRIYSYWIPTARGTRPALYDRSFNFFFFFFVFHFERDRPQAVQQYYASTTRVVQL